MAFVVSPIVGSLPLNGWHLGLASADGTIAGFYNAQTAPRCYVHDFAWWPDEKALSWSLPAVVVWAGSHCSPQMPKWCLKCQPKGSRGFFTFRLIPSGQL